MTGTSIRRPGLKRGAAVSAILMLLFVSGVAAWWFGPWNAQARYTRMPLLALHHLADDHPEDLLAWHVLALRLAQDGDADLAEPALRQAFTVNPNDVTVAIALSQLLVATNRPGEAFQILKQTTGRQPASVPARLELGRLYQRRGAFQYAAAEYEAVTAADARNPDAWFLLAQCYYSMQKTGQAQSAMERALKLRENDANFFRLKATLDAAVGHRDDAIAAARRAASLAPDDLAIQANFAETLLQHHRSGDDLQEAEGTIGRLEQLNPNYAPLSSLRGDLEAARGHWDAAARYYLKATEMLPESDHAYYALAQAYRRLNRKTEAARYENVYARRQSLRQRIGTLHTAIGSDPRNADLFQKLSLAELEFGHRVAAIEALEGALAISPGDRDFQKRLAKLKQGVTPTRGQ